MKYLLRFGQSHRFISRKSTQRRRLGTTLHFNETRTCRNQDLSIIMAPAYSREWYRSPNFCPSICSFFRSFVRPSTFTSKFGFLDINDSCESQTLHSNCPWHTLQARTLIPWPWLIFHGPLTLTNFTSKFGFLDISDCCEACRSLVFSTSVIAASLKPCIVIVLDIPFKHTPWTADLDLYFMVHWLC